MDATFINHKKSKTSFKQNKLKEKWEYAALSKKSHTKTTDLKHQVQLGT